MPNQKGTELGYGKGDFVPDLTVNYTIIDKSTGKKSRAAPPPPVPSCR